MTTRDKTRIASAGLAIGLAQLCHHDDAPKTVRDMVARIEQRGHAALDTLPDPTDKEARSINRRITELGEQIQQREALTGVALSSFLLAVIESAMDGLRGEQSSAFNALHTAMRGLHRYYDRNLRNHNDYRAADQLATWWQQAA
jgi:hypothetical protein